MVGNPSVLSCGDVYVASPNYTAIPELPSPNPELHKTEAWHLGTNSPYSKLHDRIVQTANVINYTYFARQK